MTPRSLIGLYAIDNVATIIRQPILIQVRRPRFSVLTSNATHLHHRGRRTIGKHHSHLQKGLHIGTDVGFCVRLKRLRAVPALKEERAAQRNIGQLFFQFPNLRGYYNRRDRLKNLADSVRLLLVPGGLLQGCAREHIVKFFLDTTRKRRQIGKLCYWNINCPTHALIHTMRLVVSFSSVAERGPSHQSATQPYMPGICVHCGAHPPAHCASPIQDQEAGASPQTPSTASAHG